MSARLVAFSGLPGSGKSTLARAVGRLLGVPVWSKDELEAALVRRGLPEGVAGYEVLAAVVETELRAGRDVVCDSVLGQAWIRDRLRALAESHGARFLPVECRLADETLHRRRIEGRDRAIPGWCELAWDDVVRARARFETWEGEVLRLDTAAPVDESMARLRRYLS